MSSERQLLEEKSPWWAEHIHRYEEVLKHLKNTDKVLDIACGTGFGSNILAKKANIVIGADLDEKAIDENKTIWKNDKLKFEVIDGTQIPYEDEYFDVIVSFETIEHTTSFEKMLDEFKRVVKPGGILFISTPNIYLNSPTGIVTNPFHTQEFTPEEFKELIASRFENYEIYGQEYIRYKNKTNLAYAIAKSFEKFHYQRGIRKIPISIQDIPLRLLIGKTQYPLLEDYQLNPDTQIIKEKCVTQLAICKK